MKRWVKKVLEAIAFILAATCILSAIRSGVHSIESTVLLQISTNLILLSFILSNDNK